MRINEKHIAAFSYQQSQLGNYSPVVTGVGQGEMEVPVQILPTLIMTLGDFRGRLLTDDLQPGNVGGRGHLGEWQIASDAHAILEQGPNPVPYSMLLGNHDFVGSGSPDYARDTSLYNEYFGPARFVARAWHGGHRGTTNDNNYSLFSMGKDW